MRRALILCVLASAVAASPLLAQDGGVTVRVDKLEKEMKAVQRKVFPKGAPIEPDMGGTAETTSAGSTSAVADLTARVDALDAQLKRVTGQVESQQTRLIKVEEQLKAIRTQLDASIGAPEAETSSAPAASTPIAVAPKAEPKADPKPVAAAPAATPAKTKIAAPASVPAGAQLPVKADAKRKTLIDAVEVPRTGDAGEDTYVYGFRLWKAKLYPEAQVKLKEVSAKYPKHKRFSHAKNLLGKAYLDEGKPGLAAVAFYDHYQKMPTAERADDSLYNLGVALTKLKKQADACKAFDEFKTVYGATAPAALKVQVAKARTDAKCAA